MVITTGLKMVVCCVSINIISMQLVLISTICSAVLQCELKITSTTITTKKHLSAYIKSPYYSLDVLSRPKFIPQPPVDISCH